MNIFSLQNKWTIIDVKEESDLKRKYLRERERLNEDEKISTSSGNNGLRKSLKQEAECIHEAFCMIMFFIKQNH